MAQASVWLGLELLVNACAILQAQDFQQGVDHLSQADDLTHWRLSQAVVAGTEGETVWIYTVRAHV